MELFDVYPLMNIEPESARGSRIKDVNGREYLDLYGGHAVISIGHSHPHYVSSLKDQLNKIGFYSNSIENPVQNQLAQKLGLLSGMDDYRLFLCNSGTESTEAALKLARYHTGRNGVIAISNGFHGRTAGAASVTSNSAIKFPSKTPGNVYFTPLNDLDNLEEIFKKKHEIGAVILECIQGIGGVEMVSKEYYLKVHELCEEYGALLIADEVQSGFGRTGRFFSFQYLSDRHLPHLVTMAKGMGNGFPVGGVLVSNDINAEYGLLGSTFGGNHLACKASTAVLEIIENESLMQNAEEMGEYIKEQASHLSDIISVRGRGLMIGLEFDFSVAELRKKLVYDHSILTGSSSNPQVLRILPPLNISRNELEILFNALNKILKTENKNGKVYLG